MDVIKFVHFIIAFHGLGLDITSFSLILNSRAAAQLLVSSAALITWSLNAAVYCFLLEVTSVGGRYSKLIIFLY